MPEMFVARRSMEYGHGKGDFVSRGQVITMLGLVNDEKLVRLGYVSKASPGIAIVECGICSAKFTTDEALSTHGRDRHPNARAGSEEEREMRDLERSEARQKREDEIAPLDLTKTTASRSAGVASAEGTTKTAARSGARTSTKKGKGR